MHARMNQSRKTGIALPPSERLLWSGSPVKMTLLPMSLVAALIIAAAVLPAISIALPFILAASALALAAATLLCALARSVGPSGASAYFAHRYQLTEQRLIVSEAGLGLDVRDYELLLIESAWVRQTRWQRILGVGHVTLVGTSNGIEPPELVSVRSPLEVKEMVRTAVLARRAAAQVSYIEVL